MELFLIASIVLLIVTGGCFYQGHQSFKEFSKILGLKVGPGDIVYIPKSWRL